MRLFFSKQMLYLTRYNVLSSTSNVETNFIHFYAAAILKITMMSCIRLPIGLRWCDGRYFLKWHARCVDNQPYSRLPQRLMGLGNAVKGTLSSGITFCFWISSYPLYFVTQSQSGWPDYLLKSVFTIFAFFLLLFDFVGESMEMWYTSGACDRVMVGRGGCFVFQVILYALVMKGNDHVQVNIKWNFVPHILRGV